MIVEGLYLLGVGVLRNVAGWVENLGERKDVKYEAGKLLATVLRFLVLGFGLHYCFNLDIVTTMGLTTAADFGINKITSAVKNT